MKLPVNVSDPTKLSLICEEAFTISGFMVQEHPSGFWSGVREESSGESTLLLQLSLKKESEAGVLAVHATRMNHRTALLESDEKIETLFAMELENRLSLI
ncbi:MAG: hypothetical protein ACKO1U_05240 [Bacteroidota bacterium]